MSHREVASLSCTVSLLCAFEEAQSWKDWTVGTHGLIIDFFGEAAPYLAPGTLCPDVQGGLRAWFGL